MIVIKAAFSSNSSLFQTFYERSNGRGVLFSDHTGKKARLAQTLLLSASEFQTVTKG